MTDQSNTLWKFELLSGSKDLILENCALSIVPEADDGLKISGVGPSSAKIVVSHGHTQLGSAIAGPSFTISIPSKPGSLRLEMHDQSGAYRIWEIVKSGSGPFALAGGGRHLFLAGDSNDSVNQFSKNQTLSPSSIKAWRNMFERFKDISKEFSLKNISLLIAPSKEEILRDFYPKSRAQETFLDSFMREFGNEKVIYPRWPLWNTSELSWSRTDTHWTDFGATVAAKELLKAWDIPSAGLPECFNVVQRIGDLGSKVSPHMSSYELCYTHKVMARKAFDNGVGNHGNIQAYLNEDAPQRQTVLILGDSFGVNLAAALSGVFSNVIYAYRPAGIDPYLMQIVKPDNIVLEITSRFLHGQPITDGSIFETSVSKINEMSECERQSTLNRLREENRDVFGKISECIIKGFS